MVGVELRRRRREVVQGWWLVVDGRFRVDTWGMQGTSPSWELFGPGRRGISPTLYYQIGTVDGNPLVSQFN